MAFQIGERIVHSAHGVGEIMDIGVRKFGKRGKKKYYEVHTPQLTVWVPVDPEHAEQRLRRLTPSERLPELKKLLQSKPKKLKENYRSRQAQIRTRLQDGRLKNLVEVVRDLTALSRQRPLNGSDEQQLNHATRLLCREWGAIRGWDLEQAEQEILGLLSEAHEQRQASEKRKLQATAAYAD